MHRSLLAGLALAVTSLVPATAQAGPRWLDPIPPFGDVPALQNEAAAVMAQDGRIVFARIAPDRSVEVRERPPGGPVGAPVPIADATAGAVELRVMIGADGTAAVLFEAEGERYASLRRPDGAWSPAAPVGPPSDAEAIAPDGVLWRVGAAPGDADRLAVYRAPGPPEPVLLAAPAAGASDVDPALALPGAGGAHIVYVEEGATSQSGQCLAKTVVLAADVSVAGVVPRPPARLDSFTANGTGSATQCAFDGGSLVSGTPLLVTDARGADTAVYAALSFPALTLLPQARHRDGGGAWPAAGEPAEIIDNDDVVPGLLIGGRGIPLVVLRSGAGDSEAVRRPDGTWSAAAPLSPGARVIHAARTGLGTTLLAWVERGTGRIVGRVVSADGTVGDPVELAPTALASTMLAVGGDTEGNGVALFSHPRGGGLELLAAGYDAAGPRRTALEVPSDGAAGDPLDFSAAGLDVWSGPVTDVTWDFGDGTEGAGATVRHAYADAGGRVVRIRLRDASGNATDTFAVTEIGPPRPVATPVPTATPTSTQKPSEPGLPGTAGGGPAQPARDTRAPSVSVRRGPFVRGRLSLMVTTSEPGRLKLTLRCVGSGAKCRRARTVTRTVSAGTGRVSLPSLRPGTWTATATVTDAAGNASRARSLRLRVPRPGYAT